MTSPDPQPAQVPADPMAAHPLLNRNGMLTVAGIVAALWLTALVSGSKIVAGIMAVVTLAIAGGLVYVWRMAKKQKQVMDLLQSAGASPEARQRALAQLEAQGGGSKDVLNAIARAQLQAQDDPDKALATLEGIDLQKVPAAAADEVRTFRAQMYLYKNRVKEARELADAIKLANAANGQSRAMMTAVVAEAWARTGKAEAGLDLLADVKFDDPELAQLRVPLLVARVFAHFGAGKKERARKDMEALMKQDVNLLGRFAMPGQAVHFELQKLAQDVLRSHPDMRKMARNQQQAAFRRTR